MQASVQAAFPESTVSYHRIDEDAVTIGEALEATALVLGHFTNYNFITNNNYYENIIYSWYGPHNRR